MAEEVAGKVSAEEEKEYAIEKIRKIAAWSNYQDEHVNFRFNSISEIEKAYDVMMKLEGSEFLDELDEDDEDDLALMEAINTALGRKFF